MVKHPFLSPLVGNVYRNLVSGEEWKLIDVEQGGKLVLQDKYGNKFETVPALTGNYIFIGKSFSTKKARKEFK